MPDDNSSDEAAAKKWPNIVSLIIFFIFMILYVGIAAYAFSMGVKENLDKELVLDPVEYILYEYKETMWILAGSFLISTFIAILCLLATRDTPAYYMVAISVVLQCLYLIIEIYNRGVCVASAILVLAGLCYFYVNVLVLLRIRPKLFNKIVEESRRVIFSCPFSILLPVITLIPSYFVIYFTLTVRKYLFTIDSILPLHYLNLICGSWLVLSLFHFTIMVLFKIYAGSMETPNLFDDVKNPLLKCISTIFRYHLGTTVRAASLYAPLPIWFALIKNLIYVVREAPHNIIVMITCWFHVNKSLYFNSSGVSAITIINYEKSTDKTCRLYMRHPLQFIASLQAFVAFAFLFGSIWVWPTKYFVEYSLLPPEDDENVGADLNATIMVALFIILEPFVLILWAAINSVTFQVFKNFDESGLPANLELSEFMAIQ